MSFINKNFSFFFHHLCTDLKRKNNKEKKICHHYFNVLSFSIKRMNEREEKAFLLT